MDEQQIKEQLNAEENNYRQNRKLLNRYIIFFLTLAVIIGSFWLGYTRGKRAGISEQNFPLAQTLVLNKTPAENKTLDFSLFWKVWDLLKEKYVDRQNLDAQKLLYGSIEGMLRATGDPYSNFFDPKETKSFSQDMEGSFEGIGAELGVKDKLLTVIAPLDDSPAKKAGIRTGDKIIKIGDKVAADLDVDSAVEMIRGKKGTEVKLTVLHMGEQDTQEITIIRDTIIVKSVKLEWKEGEIAYVKITKFGDDTSKEFNSIVNQIVSRGAKGIILDLRNNPGGYLDRSIDVASRMLPKSKVVVIEEDNLGNKEKVYTTGGDKLSGIPIVALINEGSASASEILAGALRDDRDISLVGKKTFGKGSVQELMSLPGNSSVKISVAKWMTPNGDYIMEKGISPSIEVELTIDDYNNNRDPQLDKALEVLKEKMTP